MKKTCKNCYNCKHSGEPFKIGKGTHTHLHCEHPDEEVSGDKTSGWDTLVEWYHSCKHFEQKTEP